MSQARTRLFGFWILLLLSGCRVPSALSRADCSARPPRLTVAYDSTGWANLVGRFTLVTVITSEGLAGHVKRTLLRLDTVAASERWFRSDGLRGPRGALRFRPVRGVEITRFRGELWRDSAEVEGTVLYTGCRECTDASPVEYEIQFVSAWGFWGRWRNRQTGIVRALDRTGRNLAADPAGYFCALRQ